MSDARPVGVFDSGVGGLSVWREIARQLPHESTVYFADQCHVPYGPRPAEEVRRHAEGITAELLARDCKAVVVACNTASAAALKDLRARYPDVPFVGMEPAVKPAALHTKSRVVGVMATPGTLAGRMFMLAVERFAAGLTLVNQPCPGLVERIESGDVSSPELEALLRERLAPMLKAGADTIVLACTHYPFVLPLIRRIAGDAVHVVDPAPAVARHLGQLLAARGLAAPAATAATHRFVTTGSPEALALALRELAGAQAQVERARWQEGHIADRAAA
jgi:glutamate racemase